MRHRKLVPFLLLGLTFAVPALASASPFDLWQFLIGDWAGVGGGSPGQGAGTFSFKPDLDGRVLVRRSHSEYAPAAKGGKAVAHDDFMIVHSPAQSGYARAEYFDSEGHTISYQAIIATDGKTITFLSEQQAVPRYRLTYERRDNDQVAIKFELSPSGKDEDFKTYLEGSAKKVSP